MNVAQAFVAAVAAAPNLYQNNGTINKETTDNLFIYFTLLVYHLNIEFNLFYTPQLAAYHLANT